MRETDKQTFKEIQVCTKNDTFLAYTDNILLTTHTQDELRHIMTLLKTMASKIGLTVNAEKTEYIFTGRHTQGINDRVDNAAYKCVKTV